MAEDTTKKEEKIKNEFLIFKIESNPSVNNSYKFLGLSDSMTSAKKLINELPPKETGRMIILEKKLYYERKPAITLIELQENLIVEPPKS
jgi:hypothetical protein